MWLPKRNGRGSPVRGRIGSLTEILKIPYLHTNPIKGPKWRAAHGIGFNEAENRISEAVRVLSSMGRISALGSVIRKGDLDLFAKIFNWKTDIPLG